MRSSWTTAILLGLVAASGSANAVVITPVSAVLTASATSGGGTVTAEPVIVGAIYGQFSNSAASRNPDCDIGGSCDGAYASIFVSVEPTELSLRGLASAGKGLGNYGAGSGASALVEFEVSRSSDWLLYVMGFDWNPWGRGPRLELSNSSGTIYRFDGTPCFVCEAHGHCKIVDCHLTLDPGLYSLRARIGTGDWYGGRAGADLQASLRPVPNTVPIPTSFGTLGPDLLVFGLICLFIVLRQARQTQQARAKSEGPGG